MTPDLQDEFQLLGEKARQQLRDVPESKGYRHVFSICVMPSFSPAYRCTIYAPSRRTKDKLPFAAFTTWRSDLDYEKIRTPIDRLRHPKDLLPTMEHENLSLTDTDVENFQVRIRGLPIPMYLGPPTVVGCDGTGFEFRYDEGHYSAALRWWEDHPSEWRPFTKVVVELVKELVDRRKGKIVDDIAR